MGTHNTLPSLFQDIADSIRNKTGDSSPILADDFPTAIDNIPTGSEPSFDVLFVDYDGEILYQYSKEEFTALTVLPEQPAKTGLTSQGWNWSLSDAKTYLTTHDNLVIGPMYAPANNATKLYISVPYNMTVPFNFQQSVSQGIRVDFGQGAAAQTFSGTGNINTSVTYAKGDYTVTFYVDSGNLILGQGAYNTQIISDDKINILTKVEIGKANVADYGFYMGAHVEEFVCSSNCTSIGSYAFFSNISLKAIILGIGLTQVSDSCFNRIGKSKYVSMPNTITSVGMSSFSQNFGVESVSIPDSVTTIGAYAFYNCPNLKRISSSNNSELGSNMFYEGRTLPTMKLPEGITSLPANLFVNCYCLDNIVIPNTVTSIAQSFSNCYSLSEIIIPSSVTSIGASSFSSNFNLKRIRFMSSTPPTLTASSAFSSLPKTCVIEVPTGSLSTYTSASNYPSSSTYTYVEY